ncbi:MAG: phosphatase PAP2 family protein [Ruminococcaceae bacterium]|nr:phosphatase PAP2 family protein [Oscillospiraceae bacterium]
MSISPGSARSGLRRITPQRGRHLWWLLFWPVYWLRYPLIERGRGEVSYHPVYCPADDLIPFCEVFIVPYMLWMVLMVAVCLYTLCCDVDTFRLYSRFLVIAMSLSTVIFLLWPSCQQLRPETFARDNLFTRCVALLYAADTNTNVFPSEHAIGSAAVWLAVRHARGLASARLRVPLCVLAALTCVSTVFLKQHSVLDLLGAAPVCLIAWYFSFRTAANRQKSA